MCPACFPYSWCRFGHPQGQCQGVLEITFTLPGSQEFYSSQDSLEVAASASASSHCTEMSFCQPCILGAQTARGVRLELSTNTLNSTS